MKKLLLAAALLAPATAALAHGVWIAPHLWGSVYICTI